MQMTGATDCPDSLLAAAALAAAVVLCGCAGHATGTRAPQTHVAVRTIQAPAAERYDVAPEENSNVPVQIADAAPEYPRGQIGLGIPLVSVRAKVIVDTEGRVADVRFAAAADGHAAEFDDAVRAAVSRWRYAPLRIQAWKDVLDAQGNVVDAERVKDELKPFSLDYEFSFYLRDGKPVVATNSAR